MYPLSSQYASVQACGVGTIAYMSPSMPQNGEDDLAISYGGTKAGASPAPSPGPYYDVLAKTSAGALVTSYGGTGYLADPHPTDAAAYFQRTVSDALSLISRGNGGAQPNFIFFDNFDSTYGVTGTPYDYVGWNDWATYNARDLAGLTGPKLILNTLGNTTAYEYPPADDTISNILLPVRAASVGGAMLENTYWGNQNQSGYHDALGNPSGAWVAQEDMEITDIAAGKFFNALANGTFTTYEKTNGVSSANGTAARMFVYASTLLTYDPAQYCGLPQPGCVLFGEETSPPSGVDAYPEEQFLAMYPMQSAHVTVSELRIGTTAAYARPFQGCYYRGTLIGQCEVVVNPSPSSVTIPTAGYTRQVQIQGGDIDDSGTLDFTAAASSALAPHTAEILLP